MACIPTCQQPLEVGLENCTSKNAERFFFDQRTKSCKQFNFLGCIQNRNNFETQEECEVHHISMASFLILTSQIICLEGDYGKFRERPKSNDLERGYEQFERPTPNDENNEICQDLEKRIPSFRELKENILDTHDMGETNNINNIMEKAKQEIQAQKPNINSATSGLSNSASMQIQSAMIASRPTAFRSIISNTLILFIMTFLGKRLFWIFCRRL